MASMRKTFRLAHLLSLPFLAGPGYADLESAPAAQQAMMPGTVPAHFLKLAGSLQGTDGSPMSDKRALVFHLSRPGAGTAPIWSERQEVEVQEGFYSALLGSAEPLTAPPGGAYFLSVRLEGSNDPIEVHQVSIVVPAGGDGVARSAGTPVYRLVPSPDAGRRHPGREVFEAPGLAGSELASEGTSLTGAEVTSATSGPWLLPVGVEVQETSGNAGGSLEPGETVNLKVKLSSTRAPSPAARCFPRRMEGCWGVSIRSVAEQRGPFKSNDKPRSAEQEKEAP